MDPEALLSIDPAQLRSAKTGELMKPITVKFIDQGPDRTVDNNTKYPKQCSIEGVSGQETILELRQKIAVHEKMSIEDVNLFGLYTSFTDKLCIGDLYVDWMGLGLDDWPPRFIAKPRVQGFEVYVDVPSCRDTSIWENGRMVTYQDRQLVFDVKPSTTVDELKELIARRTGIPAQRHKLTAHLRASAKSIGDYVSLDDDRKTMKDYKIQEHGVSIKFEKSSFDEDGNFVFDDAYWDSQGYHAPPAGSWIPLDSLCDRSRPDANKVDPTQPLNIISDRRQAEAKS